MKPSIKNAIDESSLAVEKLIDILIRKSDDMTPESFIDFAARMKGLDSAVSKLREASADKVKVIIEKQGQINPANPLIRQFSGEAFLAAVTLVSTPQFQTAAFKTAHSDLYEQFTQVRDIPRLTFNVR